jgi:tetratricopeptide (TPR) repeat protein
MYPGISAQWVAFCTGLERWPDAAYPLWRLWLAFWRMLPIGSETWRLNVSSAVAGAVAGALFCRYVIRWVFAALDSRIESPLMHRVPAIAVAAGGLTAFIFGASPGGWGASTRLGPFAFHILLVAWAFSLQQGFRFRHAMWRAYLLALLCGLAIIETSMFLLILPFLVASVAAALYRRRRLRPGPIVGLMLAGVAGIALALFCAHLLSPGERPVDWLLLMRRVAWLEFRSLRAAVPRFGWSWLLMLVAVPWVALQLRMGNKLLARNAPAAGIAVFLGLLVVTLLLFAGTPIPPWSVWEKTGRLPVLESAIVAMTGGWVATYWLAGWLMPPRVVDLLASAKWGMTRLMVAVSGAVCLTGGLILVFIAIHNAGQAGGRRGGFADQCAREILLQMNERSWLVTDGSLDLHLAHVARESGRELHLVNLSRSTDTNLTHRLREAVKGDASLLPHAERLVAALGIGPAAFISEWVAADPQVASKLALFGVQDFWGNANLPSLPEGFLVLARGTAGQPAAVPPLAATLDFRNRLLDVVSMRHVPRTPADLLRLRLRRHLARVLNERGVLLEDLRRNEEAYEAYEEALRFDSDNPSARINRAGLARQGVRPADKERAEAAETAALNACRSLPSPAGLVSTFGQVRNTTALAGVAGSWLRAGRHDLARMALSKAVEVAPEGQAQDAAQQMQACLGVLSGDHQESERLLRDILRRQPDSPLALRGLIGLELDRHDTASARSWLDRMRAQRPADACDLDEAVIELAENAPAAAASRLHRVIDAQPENTQALALLAVALVRQGLANEAADYVLPRLAKAVGKAMRPLYFEVVAMIETSRKPPAFQAARQAYRYASAMQPGRPDLVAHLLRLDLALRDRPAAAQDARRLLSMNPDNALGHFVMGTQAEASGDLATAQWHLTRSVATNGTLAAWNNLADILRRRGQLDEAERAARQALSLGTNNPAVLDTLAFIVLEKGRPDEAASLIQQVCREAPDDWRFALSAVRILRRADRRDDADRVLRELAGRQQSLPPEACREIATLSPPRTTAAKAASINLESAVDGDR